MVTYLSALIPHFENYKPSKSSADSSLPPPSNVDLPAPVLSRFFPHPLPPIAWRASLLICFLELHMSQALASPPLSEDRLPVRLLHM